jgi:hypothetical protein
MNLFTWPDLPFDLHPDWRGLMEAYRANDDIGCETLTECDRSRLELLVAMVDMDGCTEPCPVLLDCIRDLRAKLELWERMKQRHGLH